MRTCTGTNLTPRNSRPPYSRSSTPSDSYYPGSVQSRLPTLRGYHCKRCNRGFDRLGALSHETPVFRVGKSRSAKGKTERVPEKATGSTLCTLVRAVPKGQPGSLSLGWPHSIRLRRPAFFGNLVKEHRFLHRGAPPPQLPFPPLCQLCARPSCPFRLLPPVRFIGTDMVALVRTLFATAGGTVEVGANLHDGFPSCPPNLYPHDCRRRNEAVLIHTLER